MGADLYIQSITDKEREQFEPLFNAAVLLRDHQTKMKGAHHYVVEHLQALVGYYCDLMSPEDGYFRDSYNATSVLMTLNLSW